MRQQRVYVLTTTASAMTAIVLILSLLSLEVDLRYSGGSPRIASAPSAPLVVPAAVEPGRPTPVATSFGPQRAFTAAVADVAAAGPAPAAGPPRRSRARSVGERARRLGRPGSVPGAPAPTPAAPRPVAAPTSTGDRDDGPSVRSGRGLQRALERAGGDPEPLGVAQFQQPRDDPEDGPVDPGDEGQASLSLPKDQPRSNHERNRSAGHGDGRSGHGRRLGRNRP